MIRYFGLLLKTYHHYVNNISNLKEIKLIIHLPAPRQLAGMGAKKTPASWRGNLTIQFLSVPSYIFC